MPLPEHLAELDRRYRARLEAATDELRRSFEQRLLAATEGLTSALAEVRAATPESLLDASDFEPIESAARQAGERAALDALLESALGFDVAGSQGALLDALLDAARRFAPRAALLIVDRDGARGWGAIGFGAESERFAERRTGWSGESLAAFAAGEGVVRARGAAAADLADRLDFPIATESVLVPLVLRDRIAAALYADRRTDEPELPFAALQLLALGAAQRLELQALATRAYTPTLHEAGAVAEPGLPLWDPTALPEPQAPPLEVGPGPALEPAEAWVDEAAGAVFELEPESLETETEPVAPPEPRGLETMTRTGIEELFEAEPPEPIVPPPVETTAWSGPDVVSWAQPEAPAMAPPADSWAARDVVSWAASEAATPAPPPAEIVVPAAEPEWEMVETEGDATVLVSGTPGERRALGFDLEPAGSESAGELPAAETTAPIPVFAPPSAATMAVPTVALPIAPDLTEDATLLVSRPVPPSTPPVTATAEATQQVARPESVLPPPGAIGEAAEDETHPSLKAPPPGAEEDINDRTAARAPRGTEVAPPPDLQGPGLAFTMSRTQRASGDNALHEEARRLARLLVSEIKLYNEEQVEEGRRHRDLYLRLREDIDRSRQIYDERVHDSVRGTTDYFQQELIRSLAGGDPRALGM